MKKFFIFAFGLLFFSVSAQKDSIFVRLEPGGDESFSVSQTIVYHNNTNEPLSRIKLLNWAAAYRNTRTPLAERKLEDRKTDLYFAKKSELPKISDLVISIENHDFINLNTSSENLYIPLEKPLLPNENLKIKINYLLKLPSAKFTGYGKTENGFYFKYFFIVPSGEETSLQKPQYYLDIDENQTDAYWEAKFETLGKYFAESNLKADSAGVFRGTLPRDPEFFLSREKIENIWGVK